MHTLKIAAVAAALALTGLAQAKVRASNTYSSNFTYSTSGTYVPITSTGGTSLRVVVPRAGKYVLTFSAECAVTAPEGNTSAWVDIDLEVNGTAVAPTAGTMDAFCTANGTATTDGWSRNSITTAVDLLDGPNTIRVLGKFQAGATGGWLSDSAIVVHD